MNPDEGPTRESDQPQQPAPPPQQPAVPSGPVSASQMGLNDEKPKVFDLQLTKGDKQGYKKKLIMGLGVLFIVAAALVVTGIGEFRNIKYTNKDQMQYRLDFYNRHLTASATTGNPQLISKVAKDGKFPLTVSISTGEAKSFDAVKNCYNYEKVFEVQNNHVSSKIAVCNVLKGSGIQGDAKAGVYVAGFVHEGRSHLVTISQDFKKADLSSPSAAQKALTQYGLQPYHDDIKRIVGSIEVVGLK